MEGANLLLPKSAVMTNYATTIYKVVTVWFPIPRLSGIMNVEGAERYYLHQRKAYWEKTQGEERRRAQNRLNQYLSRWNRKNHVETVKDYSILTANVIAMGKGQKPVRHGRLKDPKRRASQRLKKQHKPNSGSEEDNRSMEPDLEFSFELLDQNDASIAAPSSNDELSHILSDQTRRTLSQQRSLPPYDDAWPDFDAHEPTYTLDADTNGAWWTDGSRARVPEPDWLHNLDGSQSLDDTMRQTHASCDANPYINCSEDLMSDVFGNAPPQTPLTITRTHRELEIWMEQLSDVNRLYLHTIAAKLKSRLKKGRLIRSPQSTARQPPSNNTKGSTIEEFCHNLKEEFLKREQI
ncbi:hypothetical protein V496_02915 [Pseudogymnoascus sp. VKM F-4515 (FW-2607)]|nr:hypothetical protein V496_02915 [Pseudogymnoascus sp. VKM F-4515 (FW-2607)]